MSTVAQTAPAKPRKRLFASLSTTDRRYWAMQNGEIYNHRELRSELEELGHRFDTHCDTEVVAHAYQEWGAECLSRMNGDFALPQARALADRAAAHGVDVRLELYPADTHVFHVFWPFLPEAADALQHAGEFIREVLATQDARSSAER